MRSPLIGLFVYVGFAVLRPQFIWGWAGDFGGISLYVGVATLIGWWQQRDAQNYLAPPDTAFIAQFPPPAAPDSPATRVELDELLAMQATRTAAQVEAARADRKKHIERFYGALGLTDFKNTLG